MSDDSDGLLYGEDPTGRLVSIADVPSGIACGMVCPECHRRLVAKKGEINRHHFAHESQFACSGAQETLLHKLAKQIISDEKGVLIPPLVAHYAGLSKVVQPARWLPLDRVELEVWMDGVRPDIIGYFRDRPLAIEILATHACGPEKVAFIEARGIACIEIDVGALRHATQGIENGVLRASPRDWIFNARLAPAIAELKAQHDRAVAAAEERARADREREQQARAERERQRLAADEARAERLRVEGRAERHKQLADTVDAIGVAIGVSRLWRDFYWDKDIPGFGVPSALVQRGGKSFDDFVRKVRDLQYWIKNGEAPTHPTDLLGLPLGALLAERVERTRIEDERREAARVERERVAAEKAAKEQAERAERLAKFKVDITQNATSRMGAEWGIAWLRRKPPNRGPSVNDMTTADSSDMDYYRAWLEREISAIERAEATASSARREVLEAASRQFQSLEKGALWARSKNPKLGMKRPDEVCLEPGGIALCLRALR